MNKKSDLYHNELFTVIPKGLDTTKGVSPKDQGFHDDYVVLWSNPRDLLKFTSDEWAKIRVQVPNEDKIKLIPLVGGVYGLPSIKHTYKIDSNVQERR